jgi:hypothetical protein
VPEKEGNEQYLAGPLPRERRLILLGRTYSRRRKARVPSPDPSERDRVATGPNPEKEGFW